MCAAPRIDNLNSYTNLILNGDYTLFQRGTSVSVSNAANTYLADRWCYRPANTTGTATMSRSTDVPTVAQSGYQSQYSLLLTTTNQVPSPGATAVASLSYRLEGQDYAVIHGQACQLSFWVKSSVTGTYSVDLTNAGITRQYVSSFTINSANTWEKKTLAITMDTSGTWAFDNTLGLDLRIHLQVGTSNQTGTLNAWQTTAAANLGATGQANLWGPAAGATFLLSQVMLVKGSFAAATSLPFQRAGKTIGQELAMCQRYCFKSSSNFAGTAQAVASNQVLFAINFPTPMRSFPGEFAYTGFNVINSTNGVGLSAITWTLSAETATQNPLTGRLVGTGTGTVVAGNAAMVYSTNTGVDYFLLGAEL